MISLFKEIEMSIKGENRDEKRRFIRRPSKAAAWLHAARNDVAHLAVAHNVSEGGALLCCSHSAIVGEPLLLSLELQADERPFECKARVTWVRQDKSGKHEFGVRFLDLDEYEIDDLRYMLSGTRSMELVSAV